jgi:polar amino acid transport system substrate-binding protein
LRAAINTGNKALVRQDGDSLSGVSPALAQRLADEIDARLLPVVYTGAGPVFADAHKDVWDIAFLAIDDKRAEKIAFTRPYHTIEATYAVRSDAPYQHVGDLDQQGVRILTSQGSAYDMHLTKTLEQATLERLGTPPDSFRAFRAGTWDAVAGVRASLAQAFGTDDNIRILPGVLTKVEQAMVLPRQGHPVLPALDGFVARALDDGFVADQISA